jgi:hypothetical protein
MSPVAAHLDVRGRAETSTYDSGYAFRGNPCERIAWSSGCIHEYAQAHLVRHSAWLATTDECARPPETRRSKDNRRYPFVFMCLHRVEAGHFQPIVDGTHVGHFGHRARLKRQKDRKLWQQCVPSQRLPSTYLTRSECPRSWNLAHTVLRLNPTFLASRANQRFSHKVLETTGNPRLCLVVYLPPIDVGQF